MDAVSAAPARRSHRQWLGRASAGHSLAGAPGSKSGSPLRVAMLAPPWISVPAPGYGGVESVVSTLTEALVRRGHDVTLFCAPGSVSRANVVTLLDKSHPDEIERSLYEVDQVRRAFDALDSATGSDPFDVVHEHERETCRDLGSHQPPGACFGCPCEAGSGGRGKPREE